MKQTPREQLHMLVVELRSQINRLVLCDPSDTINRKLESWIKEINQIMESRK